jgi:hypothetical protein
MNKPDMQILITVVLAWLLGREIASSCLFWWFKTSLPVELSQILRTLGWQKRNAEFWPDDIEYMYWTRPQWELWLVTKVADRYGNFGDKVITLLSCPGCLSFHISFWCAVAVAGLAYAFVSLPLLWAILLIPASAFGWPIYANKCLSAVSVPSREAPKPVVATPVVPKKSKSCMRQPTTVPPAIDVEATTHTVDALRGDMKFTVEHMSDEEKTNKGLDTLKMRGIKYHVAENGSVIIDYLPSRERVITKFFSKTEPCPSEIQDCNGLREAYALEIEQMGGEGCTGCQLNKVRNRYRDILTSMLPLEP